MLDPHLEGHDLPIKPEGERSKKLPTSPQLSNQISRPQETERHLSADHTAHIEHQSDVPESVESTIFPHRFNFDMRRFSKGIRLSSPVGILSRWVSMQLPRPQSLPAVGFSDFAQLQEAVSEAHATELPREKQITLQEFLQRAATKSKRVVEKVGKETLKWTAFVTSVDDVMEGGQHWQAYLTKKKELATASPEDHAKLGYQCKKLKKKAAKSFYLGITSIASDAFTYPSFVLGFIGSAIVYASLFTVLGSFFGMALSIVGTEIERRQLKKLEGQSEALQNIFNAAAALKSQDTVDEQTRNRAELLENYAKAYHRQHKASQFYHSLRLGAFVLAGVGAVVSLGSFSVADLGILGFSIGVLSLGVFIGAEVLRIWQKKQMSKMEKQDPTMSYTYLLGKVAEEIVTEQSLPEAQQLFSHLVADRLLKLSIPDLLESIEEKHG